MPPITQMDPQLLKDRHRLSVQQINHVFGRKVLDEGVDERLYALGKVKEFLELTDTLSSVSIKFIPLKGPLLSYRIYNDPVFRDFKDLDILVCKDDLERSLSVLQKQGYIIQDIQWSGNKLCKGSRLHYSHHVSLYNPEKDTIVELHWNLLGNNGVNVRKVEKLIRKNISEITFAGRSFRVLSNEMELLYLIMHGGFHSWGRLKWLADTRHFVDNIDIDRDDFFELNNEMHADRLISLHNILQEEYFPGHAAIRNHKNIPSYMLSYVEKTISRDEYLMPAKLEQILQSIRYSLLAFSGFDFKIRSLKNYVMSSIFFGRIGAFPRNLQRAIMGSLHKLTHHSRILVF